MIRIVKNKSPRAFISFLIIVCLYLQIITMIPGYKTALFASGQTSCVEKLDQAEEYYYDGEFDQTIQIVNQCLQAESLPKELQIRSYTILARTYLAKEDTNRTKDNIRIILKLEPTYQPTIEQETPQYVNLVTEVRKEEDQFAAAGTGIGISSWLLIGAGGAAAVAIITIVASGSSNENGTQNTSLPKPPDFPD